MSELRKQYAKEYKSLQEQYDKIRTWALWRSCDA